MEGKINEEIFKKFGKPRKNGIETWEGADNIPKLPLSHQGSPRRGKEISCLHFKTVSVRASPTFIIDWIPAR